MDALFETLRYSADDADDEISIHDNPGAADCNRSIAEDKGWTVIADAETFEEISQRSFYENSKTLEGILAAL